MAGDSDAQIINFLVSRYGEFSLLLKPPLSWHDRGGGRTPGITAPRHPDDRRGLRAATQHGPLAMAETANFSAAEELRLAECGDNASPIAGARRFLGPFCANTQLRGNMLFFLDVSASDITKLLI